MLKFLKGVVGSGGGIKDLPYNLGEPYPSAWGAWTHYRGTSKDDNSPVSIFSFTATNAQDGRLAAARNGAKRLRTVRHPNILAFLHGTEVESMEGGVTKPTVYIVTEPVMPLAEKIKELNLEGIQREEYYAWGLHQVAKAVSFLNNDCKLVHGNVCLASVVVTPTLDWKLHALDVLSEFDGGSVEATAPMFQYEWLVGTQYKAMELAKNDWETIRKSPPWAIDSWGIGCLIYELFSGSKLTRTEELRNTVTIPKNLLPDYQRLLGSVPSKRLNSSKLIDNSEFFQNKLVETIQFMEILNLKDSIEKEAFFRKLPNVAEQLPRQIATRKLLPLLASALEFGSASAPALNPLLKMGSWLSNDEFTSKVLPTVVKLFASSDRAIRVSLLQNIESFGNNLSNQIVDEQVFPHIASGFSDTSAFLRELTLKSMLTLAPKLSQRTITGSFLKHLSRLQVDEEPAIRTNTTILIGNIAGHLNEATRKRVLINAFTVRALRDGFSPARGAGLMALMATSEYYDVTEVASRILPSVVVLIVDADRLLGSEKGGYYVFRDVRTKAFQASELFLKLVKQHQSKVDVGETVDTSVGLTATTNSSSLLGWAVSSFTLKTKGADHTASTMVSNVATTRDHNSDSSSSFGDSNISSNSVVSNQPNEPAAIQNVSDGWGELENGNSAEDDDKDGWDDMGLIAEPVPPPSLARIHAAQQRPISTTKAQVLSSSSITGGSDVDATNARRSSTVKQARDDDPWADIAAPAPLSSVRPLSNSGSSVPARGLNGPRVRQAQHVSIESVLGNTSESAANSGRMGSGRGRGRTTPMRLGAQRVSRPSDQ
ncbi:hypothetical protein O6H91_07G018900 [Diphasiastrum complanatum]|uniref:Uncharacterized protein n=1 Tax=Diphasiastrum complanatum TaxID=34168 RepID=A0ACC2D3A5_DIPCM|nr:hypothetical protein O6H91_07G018900 [Diphasiastrum complanatum]